MSGGSGSAARDDFAGPRLVHGPRYPDFFGDVPRPPRAVPDTRRPACHTRSRAAGPPVPRPRPGDVTGSVKVEPASPVPAAQHRARRSGENRCAAGRGLRIKRKRPGNPGRSLALSDRDQAAALCGLPSITLPFAEIGMERGFLASGISRTRSTCRRPFSRAAPLTWTKSASWKTRSNARAAMP